MALNPEHLKARAREATGLDDFGSEPMDDGLGVYCAALRDEAGLNQAGLDAVEASTVATLSERLRVEACLRANPEILDQKLLPQIFVVGLPRTGSTALSQFLSEDPDARSIRRWEINSLTPPPDVEQGLGAAQFEEEVDTLSKSLDQAAFDAYQQALETLSAAPDMESADRRVTEWRREACTGLKALAGPGRQVHPLCI